MRGRAGSVSQISVFPTLISVSRLKMFAIWTLQFFSLFTGMNFSNEFCINCSDTALRVAKALIGAKVITLCFAMFALFLEFHASSRLRTFLVSETVLKFVIYHMNPRWNYLRWVWKTTSVTVCDKSRTVPAHGLKYSNSRLIQRVYCGFQYLGFWTIN